MLFFSSLRGAQHPLASKVLRRYNRAMPDEIISRSPWDGRIVGREPTTSAADVVAAVTALAVAFPSWARADDRAVRLQALADVLATRRQEIADLLIAEAGKVRADALAEADLLVAKIAVSLGAGLARTPLATVAACAAPGPRAWWRPRGVAVVLGPYNFPLHLLHGLVVPALAVGCTVLAKPSERCPALGALYRRCLDAAGLSTVVRVVQGGAAVAVAAIDQPAVATVAAVGGRAMGEALSRRLAGRSEVVLALELGGVNPALVLADADHDAAVAMVAEGAWKQAGQRCTATRVVHLPESLSAQWIAGLKAARARWRPGGDPAAAVGPMIGLDARRAFQRAYHDLPAGLALVAGEPRPADDASASADPLLLAVRDRAARTSPLYHEEQFGPALIVDTYGDTEADLAECLARLAANPYRLAASVFTADRARFAACAAALPYGQVNHDRPTAGARSDQPFGGLGRSGNARPAALAAGAIFADECVVW